MPTARYSYSRAGYRSAQDLFFPSFSQAPCAFRGADGGTVGGSADDHILLFVARVCGAERGHSRTLTFQFLVVAEIFFLQCRLLVCRVRQINGFLALFLEGKKVRGRARTRGRNCSPSRAHPRRRLRWKLLGSEPEVWRPE